MIDHLRNEALDLYDRCLVAGDARHFFSFIERQLMRTPPELALLSTIADELQQRLQTLREDHFDIREQVVNAFQRKYHVDITPVLPANKLSSYHKVEPTTVLRHSRLELNEDDERRLIEFIQSSRTIAARLQADIDLTISIHAMIQDWILALNTKSTEAEWNPIH